MESRVKNFCLRNMGETTSTEFILSTQQGIQDGMKQSWALFYFFISNEDITIQMYTRQQR
jgi:hypothetical protein